MMEMNAAGGRGQKRPDETDKSGTSASGQTRSERMK